MGTTIDGNRSARTAVLERVRKALGKSGDRIDARGEADRYVAAHRQGPRPRMDGDPVARFLSRANDMASTVERIRSTADAPAAIARYLGDVRAATGLARDDVHTGVCWPEFAELDWAGAGLAIEVRPTLGGDRLGITGCYCAIAETGTLVMITGPDSPTATTLLPETHVAVVDARRVVPAMEDAFALLRQERGGMPRAINMISGPSRTGDIEQTIVLGAHGPYRLHILLLG